MHEIGGRLFLLFLLFFPYSPVLAQERFVVSGYVKEKGSGELLPGVTVYVPALNAGVSTNVYGFYSLSIPAGTYTILFSSVGYVLVKKSVVLSKDVALNIDLAANVALLEDVEVMADKKNYESEKVQMSDITLTPKTVQNIPSLLGEKDLMRVLQLLPGIQSGSEASSGVYVRGGAPDENLIILDDATLYNASHLLGFFSIFNGDAIKSTKVYKGGFPARYGGRLSSVIDVSMKEGDKSAYHGKVGIGLLSSQLMLEGPIQKGKTSFLVSGRRTYLDVFLRAIELGTNNDLPGYFFHDFNAKINHEFSERDKVYLSTYYGLDSFYFNSSDEDSNGAPDFSFNWGNITSTLRWNHQYSKRLFANTSLIYSNYGVGIRAASEQENFDIRFDSSITTYLLKEDIDYFPSPRHNVKVGGIGIFYTFNPNALDLKLANIDFEREQAYNVQEGALYVEDEIKVTSRIQTNIGLRYSFFRFENTSYSAPEPRLALSYNLGNNLSVKGAYTYMNQYVHLLSNSAATLPQDLWVSSTNLVPPRRSQQVALGLAKDFIKQGLTVTMEGYYKHTQDIISYKEGAVSVEPGPPDPNDNVAWDTQVNTNTAGNIYGTEFFIQKHNDKIDAWVGYTLAWNINQSPTLNNGEPFYPRYDRRHDVSLLLSYKPNDRITVSAVWVYGTGINYTIQKYAGQIPTVGHASPNFTDEAENDDIPNISFDGYAESIYTDRLNFRGDPTHRMDLGIQFHKEKKNGRQTWDISVYNAYNRSNPFFYELNTKADGSLFLRRYTLFPTLPSISYRYEF